MPGLSEIFLEIRGNSVSVEIGAVCTKDTKIYVHNTTDYPKQQLTTEVPGASVGLTATWRTDVDTVYCTVSIFLKSVQSIQTVLRYRVVLKNQSLGSGYHR